MAGSKYVFTYESQVNPLKNLFELALDFPIIGETKVDLSLNPKEVSKTIGRTELVHVLKEKIGERTDRDQIIKAIEEFFIFASDFIRHKASGIYPSHFIAKTEKDHFTLYRDTSSYGFQVDNFSENEKYFERTVFKIYFRSAENNPIMTLFLVPEACDK